MVTLLYIISAFLSLSEADEHVARQVNWRAA